VIHNYRRATAAAPMVLAHSDFKLLLKTNTEDLVFKKDIIHQSDRTLPSWVQVIAAICGAAKVATGTVAVFITGNSNGAASLVVAGAVVSLLACLPIRYRRSTREA
jgi:hypothetical protein